MVFKKLDKFVLICWENHERKKVFSWAGSYFLMWIQNEPHSGTIVIPEWNSIWDHLNSPQGVVILRTLHKRFCCPVGFCNFFLYYKAERFSLVFKFLSWCETEIIQTAVVHVEGRNWKCILAVSNCINHVSTWLKTIYWLISHENGNITWRRRVQYKYPNMLK